MASIQKIGIPIADYHEYQGNTRDCGPHALATLYNGMMGWNAVTPEQVGAELKGRMWGATPPWSMVRWLNERGLGASRWYLRGTPDKLRQNIARDLPTIVGIGGLTKDWRRPMWWPWAHWKVMHSYWDIDGGNTWGFVDSGFTFSPTFQEHADFMREWGALLRVTVEVDVTHD